MTDMKLAVIANPYAGRGRTKKFLQAFSSRAGALGKELDIQWTSGPGHAVEIARTAKNNHDAVCVVGGDGTFHEVANGLMPDPIPVVFVPSGSGNDFAGLVGCPRTPEELFHVLNDGVGGRVDVIDCGVRYCVNSCGLGFEALVTKHSRSIRYLGGLPLYLLAAAKALFAFECPVMTVTLPGGEVIEGERLLLSIGNGVSAGGGFYLTPDARPDDGLIDLCLVDKMRRGRILRLLPLSLKGEHTNEDGVEMRRVQSLTVRCERPLHCHIDGEYIGDDKSPMSFTVLHRRLPVLCRKDLPVKLSEPLEKIL